MFDDAFYFEIHKLHKNMETNKIEKEQPKRVHTKLKFIKSDQTGAYVSFVSQNPKTGRICGVRQDSEYPKKICILDKKLMCDVLLNVLYDATLIPMSEKNGYVVIEVTPVQFKATIEVTYVPKAIYVVEVKFGNKVIRFDPKDGRKDSIRSIEGCKSILEKRVDIKDITQVVEDFVDAATDIACKFKNDGFYAKAM